MTNLIRLRNRAHREGFRTAVLAAVERYTAAEATDMANNAATVELAEPFETGVPRSAVANPA